MVYGLQSSNKGGDKGDGIVWVVQQEPDKTGHPFPQIKLSNIKGFLK